MMNPQPKLPPAHETLRRTQEAPRLTLEASPPPAAASPRSVHPLSQALGWDVPWSP